MKTALERACPQCKRPCGELELVCALCGNVLRREQRAAPSLATSTASVPSATQGFAPSSAPSVDELGDASERREPWLYLALGLAAAPIFAWTPLLQYMGWFLEALVHEMGHTACAWLCGMPAIPAISIAGEGASMHVEQLPWLALLVAAGIAAALWHTLAGRTRTITLALFAVLYPALAFTRAREIVQVLAGHGGELVFASVCFWRTLTGGFTDSRLERALYGTLGWFVLGRNASLCWGLMSSAGARAKYSSNGSFGLTNDYIRVAEDLLACRLQTVAFAMLCVCLLVLPASLLLWRLATRAERD